MYEVDEYAVSLLHFENGLKDETGKVWTANGGAALSTTQYKFGNSSLYVGGGGHKYLSTPKTDDFEFGSGDFTIDMWIYPTNLLVNQTPIYETSTAYKYEGIGIHLTGLTVNGVISASGSSWIWPSITGLILNDWNHIAFIRHNNNVYLALNGKLSIPKSITGAMVAGTSSIVMLGGDITSQDKSFPGYLDEFRISKGIARWTGDFTPGEQPPDPEPPTGQALLRVTMTDSSEREYNLPMSDISGFINWFNRAVGTGTTAYVLDKMTPNTKEYLAFDKIISFEVKDLK